VFNFKTRPGGLPGKCLNVLSLAENRNYEI
jgi:hypothetical protein